MASRYARTIWLPLAAFLVCAALPPAWAKQWTAEYEKQVGDEALAQVKKDYKLWDNPTEQQRVQSIVNDLRPFTQRPDVEYQVLLLDTDEENAFSLPGGTICVTRALLPAVQSDAELAGVLAHEMAHNCTYDALEQAQRAQQISLPLMAAVIATMLTGRGSEMVGTTLMAGLYVANGILSHYSIKIEAQADGNGLAYMLADHKYNPVGFLTFMERLAAEERGSPPVTLGVFQTHPFSTQRVMAVTHQLLAAGVEINRRAVTKWDPPQVAAEKVGDQDAQVLSLWGRRLLAFNWAPPESDPTQRGADMVSRLTALLATGAEGWDFWTEPEGDAVALKGRGETVLTVYPADAALVGSKPQQVADQARNGLEAAFFAERLKRRY